MHVFLVSQCLYGSVDPSCSNNESIRMAITNPPVARGSLMSCLLVLLLALIRVNAVHLSSNLTLPSLDPSVSPTVLRPLNLTISGSLMAKY